MPKPEALLVFCSYAHKDERLRRVVGDSLKGLIREGLISEVWSDREIRGGEDWDKVIHEKIDQADIILLLVSWAFLASDYSMGIELVRAMNRHERGEARVIPIILEDCAWQSEAFGNLQAFPTDAKPLTMWRRGVNPVRLTQVTQALREVAIDLRRSAGTPSAPRGPDPRSTVLAYLCNRADQDKALQTAWALHCGSARSRRPFVVVVHGSVEEDHAGYLARLLAYSLPEVAIGMGEGQEIQRYARMKWPEEGEDRESVLAGLARSLGSELGSDNIAIMPGQLAKLGNPALVCCDLQNSCRNYQQTAAIKAFFDFWSAWPDLAWPQALLVVLLVAYRPGYPSRFPRQEAEEILAHTRQANLSEVVLEELLPVSKANVKEWMTHPKVIKFCDVESYKTAWEQDIENTFKGRDPIPMEQLVKPLNRMLADYQRRAS